MPIIEHIRRAPAPASDTADGDPPISAADLAAVIGGDATRAGHLLSAAWALVQRHAPAAPAGILREAVIRTAGWLAEQPAASIRSEDTGDIATGFAPSMQSALRSSGSMALLSPWKIRRAGAI